MAASILYSVAFLIVIAHFSMANNAVCVLPLFQYQFIVFLSVLGVAFQVFGLFYFLIDFLLCGVFIVGVDGRVVAYLPFWNKVMCVVNVCCILGAGLLQFFSFYVLLFAMAESSVRIGYLAIVAYLVLLADMVFAIYNERKKFQIGESFYILRED